MRNFIWIFILMHCCTGENVWGQEQVVEALKAEKEEITVDGNLDDAVWQKGEWITGFTIIGESCKQAQAQTVFKIAYDGDQLYFAAKMMESCRLKIDESRKDGSVCEDDAIELIIDPYGDQSDYYVFAANAITKLDEKWSLNGLLRELEWDAEWKVATKIGKTEWAVEMAIPFAELELTERSLQDWKFNVIRNRHAVQKEEYSSYVPLVSNLMEDRCFALLRFAPDVFKKHLWNIEGPCGYLFEVDTYGTDRLKGCVNVENKGSGACNFNLIIKQVNPKSIPIIAISMQEQLCDGEHRAYDFQMPIKKQTPLKLRVELVNIHNPQEILRVERWTLNVDYEPIQLSFVEPNYRNTIYSTQNLSEIKFNLRFTLNPELLKNNTLRLQLLSPNEQKVYDKVLKELIIEKVPVHETYTMPIEELEFGSYLVRAELLNENGEVTFTKEKEFEKLRPVSYEWRVDMDGNLRKNDEMIIPTGFFEMTSEELEQWKGNYSVIFQNLNSILSAVDANTYLDKLEKLNAYGVIYPYPDESFINSCVEGLEQSLLAKEKEAIREHVKSLGRHPALMAWVLAFSPDNETISPQRLKLIYDVVSSEDPFHPCVIVIPPNRSMGEYGQIGDILMPITKLSFLKDEEPSRLLDLTSRQFDLINRLKKPGSTLWGCLQAYNQPMMTEVATRLPNVDECRSILYQSFVKGAKGFFWYHFSQFKNSPEMEPIVQFLVHELKSLQNAILAPNVPVDEKNEDLLNSDMTPTMLKRVGNDYYLFAVSLSGEKKKIQLRLPRMKDAKVLHVVSEGREVSLAEDGTFSDTFDPFEVHIYSTKAIGGITLQELKEKLKVERANKKRG